MKPILLLAFITATAQANPTGLNDAIQNLRQVAQDVSKGSQTAATGEKAGTASSTLGIGCHGVSANHVGGVAGISSHSEESSVFSFVSYTSDDSETETATAVVRPQLQCESVRKGFRQALYYWAELICITKHVLRESQRRYPDLNYIRRKNWRAETLRQWIERVFPVSWDKADQEFVHEWQPAAPIKTFTTESVEWNGGVWELEKYPRTIDISVAEGKVRIKKQRSVTQSCLQPITETLNAAWATETQPGGSVRLNLN